VLLASVREPSSCSKPFARNGSPLCLGDSRVEFSSAVVWEASRNCVRGLRTLYKSSSRNVQPRESACAVFSSTVRVPGLSTLGLAGNVTVSSVANNGMHYTSTIVLESGWVGCRRSRALRYVKQREGLCNPRKVGGGVFLATVRKPSSSRFTLARNVSPLGVSDNCIQRTSTVVLETSDDSSSRRSVRALYEDGILNFYEREIVGSVFSSTVGKPARSRERLAGNITPLGVGNSEVNRSCTIVLKSLRNEGRGSLGFVEFEC